MPLCLEGGYRLCGIRLVLEDACPGEPVTLRPLGGCSCWSRFLLCREEVLFGFLPPGDYVLTLCRRGLTLLVRLPPGGNAEILCRRDICRWRRDGWHYFFNARR